MCENRPRVWMSDLQKFSSSVAVVFDVDVGEVPEIFDFYRKIGAHVCHLKTLLFSHSNK